MYIHNLLKEKWKIVFLNGEVCLPAYKIKSKIKSIYMHYYSSIATNFMSSGHLPLFFAHSLVMSVRVVHQNLISLLFFGIAMFIYKNGICCLLYVWY